MTFMKFESVFGRFYVRKSKIESTEVKLERWSWKVRSEVRFFLTQYCIVNLPTPICTFQREQKLSNYFPVYFQELSNI